MNSKNTQVKKQIHPALLLLGGAVGGIILFALGQWALPLASPPAPSSSYKFTNPALGTLDLKESFGIGDRKALQQKLAALIVDGQKSGALTTAGVYFRDLNNGSVFGINQDTEFSPASLLKVPLAIAYFREWESDDTGILDQQIYFSGPKGISEVHYPPPQSIEEGKTYSVRQLIELMLQDSDNDATAILGQYLAKDKVDQVYKDLGVAQASDYNTYTTTLRDYAAFLRILYNATYLDKPASEEMLRILTGADFDQGIVAGVPAGTPVAHKFGERTLDEKTPLYQLNDCGIVYAQQRPYIFCVMAQGTSFESLAGFIKEASAYTYSAVTGN